MLPQRFDRIALELTKVREFPHVQQVVFALYARRSRVRTRIRQRWEAMRRHWLTALDLRLWPQQLEARVCVKATDKELGTTVRNASDARGV